MTRTFTTPLTPSDYASLFDPLRGREIRGRIESITHHGDLINLTLTPGPGLPTTFRPGQFIGLGVLIDGRWQWRCFSITDAPRPHLTSLSLGIKPVPDGAVSTHVATNAKPGDIIRLTSPGGDFYLPQPVPDKLLFVTAGSGITPVMSMVRWLRQEYGTRSSNTLTSDKASTNSTGTDIRPSNVPTASSNNCPGVLATTPSAFPDVIHIHSQRSTEVPASDNAERHHMPGPYGIELRELADETPNYQIISWNSADRGRLTPQTIAELVPDINERERFACGPAPLLESLTKKFPGTHVEHFHAAKATSDSTTTGGTIHFPAEHKETACDGATTILEAAEACGVQLTHGCRMGICHTCTATIKEGQAVDIRTGTTHREGERVRTCSAIPDGDIAIEQT
ncbi:flavin reductase family protein [Corynebacterium resistens]|uniref:flavin reductase family protein n=1 Tax=Corynebacterium resistens TaxID=258224 RepID=UPI00235622F0|nr:iron-sulfur cluster-binding domain-containing protein [Corynebacterium resistens]